ncbi:MAG: hypothetical protein AB1941_00875 [Gemmatimonadota bacterium]
MSSADALRYIHLAADGPERLRACDVDRVLESAQEDGRAIGVRAFLLRHDLLPGTRGALLRWTGGS